MLQAQVLVHYNKSCPIPLIFWVEFVNPITMECLKWNGTIPMECASEIDHITKL
jgi:hypothetical protein